MRVTSIRDGSWVIIEEEQFTLCKSTTVSMGVDGAHSRNARASVSLSFTCIDFTTYVRLDSSDKVQATTLTGKTDNVTVSRNGVRVIG